MQSPVFPTLRREIAAFLLAPDAVRPLDASPRPVPLSLGVALGFAGAVLFALIVHLATPAVGHSHAHAGLLLAPPLAVLLCFPPLYLLAALQGRPAGALELASVAVAGPTVAGTWLGASAPLLLLYALTGEVDWAFFLLAAGLAALALLAGARAVVSNARRARPVAPGGFAVFVHYGFTVWTCLVLALHLV